MKSKINELQFIKIRNVSKKEIANMIKKINIHRYDIVFGTLLFILLQFFVSASFGQGIGVNNPVPHAKSLLDLTATDKGLLTPRMTLAQRTAMFPVADATAKGMLVFQTDGTVGFYYYDGSVWQYIVNGNSGWGITGNTGTTPATNFIGTSDNQDVVFKSNNTDVMRMKPNNKLQVASANFVPSFPFSRVSIADENGTNSDIDIRVANGSYSQIVFDQSNGTLNTPTASTYGQWSGVIVGRSYDGAGFGNTAAVIFGTDSTVATGYLRGNIQFQTTGGTQNEKMRINRNGDVGIGTNNPWVRLQVEGNASGVPATIIKNLNVSGYCGTWYQSSAGANMAHYGYGNATSPKWPNQAYAGSIGNIPFILTTKDLERMRIDSIGNVGIGQTNPIQKLDVKGDINIVLDSNYRINNVPVLSTKGQGNLFTGRWAGIITTGNNNTFIGDSTGVNNTSGAQNVALGNSSLHNLTTGTSNTATGSAALYSNTTGATNTGVGAGALFFNTTGYKNSAMGGHALGGTTTGYQNTASGAFALSLNTTGFNNTAVGAYALNSNSTGTFNIGIGTFSGNNSVSGDQNIFIGAQSGFNSNGASYNIMMGTNAGSGNTTGNGNIIIGANADVGYNNLTNAIAIGQQAVVSASNSLVLGGVGPMAVKVGIGTTTPTAELEVNGYTKLGTTSPAVKMVKLTGITSAVQGNSVLVAHGLNAGKILSVELLVEYNPGSFVPASYAYTSGYECSFYFNATTLYIGNVTGNSANVLSKPFKVLITYEQ